MASDEKHPEPSGDQTEPLEPLSIVGGEPQADHAAKDTPHGSSSPVLRVRRSSTVPMIPDVSSRETSPLRLREPSPVRPPLRPGTGSASVRTRSRKNSQELSPHRAPGAEKSIPTVPSAAAVQRAMSATGIPQLNSPSAPDAFTEIPRPHRSKTALSGGATPLNPNSPRLRSPPPSTTTNRTFVYSPRKLDPPQPSPNPSILVERPSAGSTPATTPASIQEVENEEEGDDASTQPGVRTPAKSLAGGAHLETVQESSLPATPAISLGRPNTNTKPNDELRPATINENPMEEAFAKGVRVSLESGSESGGNKSGGPKKERKEGLSNVSASKTSKSPFMSTKRSMSQLNSAKSKVAGDGTVKTMTVETETVSSVPQVAVGGGAGERGVVGRTETNGSLRLKPSTETIRPKKEKKRVVRKAPSINSGTASSKADIFEAKVASAVDEANSSDPEETFVYESNPPEPLSARPHRYHSRTPSATSMASMADQYGNRVRHDGHHSIAGKKSMKFTNNPYHATSENTENGQGTGGRGHTRSNTGGNTSHHHHIGRYGRGGQSHTSLFDNESPFPNAAKPARTPTIASARLSSRPGSPRSPHTLRAPGSGSKGTSPLIYDLEGEGADDERTPLIGTVKSGRTRNSRRPGGSRQLDFMEGKASRFCRGISGCIFLGGLAGFLVTAVVLALIMCSKPLSDVHIKDIQNILASEQEIMLDLHVHAINPNLIAIQISELDVNVFAKSSYIGSSSSWRDEHGVHVSVADIPIAHATPSLDSVHRHELASQRSQPHIFGGVDEGNDPIEDPERDSQTMLLGRVREFDSPLIFDASPIRHDSLSSIGEVRLAKPGNKTEDGGTERWEKVMKHPFELIVRGVFRYSLPISSKSRSVQVGGSVTVHPEVGLHKNGTMFVSKTRQMYPPGSNVYVDQSVDRL